MKLEEMVEFFSSFAKDSMFESAKDYIDFVNHFNLKINLETSDYSLNEQELNSCLQSVSKVILNFISNEEIMNDFGEKFKNYFGSLNDYEKQEFADLVANKAYKIVISKLVKQLKSMRCEGAGKISFDENEDTIRYINDSYKNN